jgi:AmiR/NasT family two-component response regulator
MGGSEAEILNQINGIVSSDAAPEQKLAEVAGIAVRLAKENAQLLRELERRKLVERAKGILQHKHNITEEQAYLKLHNESRRQRRPMRDVAEAIVREESV